MAIPLVPVAGVALRYCAVALAAYVVARRLPKAPRNQNVEDALDTVEEGLNLSKSEDQANISGRIKRIYWVGKYGTGFGFDATFLARLKVKRVKPL